MVYRVYRGVQDTPCSIVCSIVCGVWCVVCGVYSIYYIVYSIQYCELCIAGDVFLIGIVYIVYCIVRSV